jgi:UDP-glucose 4-epimerase
MNPSAPVTKTVEPALTEDITTSLYYSNTQRKRTYISDKNYPHNHLQTKAAAIIKSVPMRILVTGGAGFIGSHLCERLIKEGHSVTALDNFSTGMASNLASLEGAQQFNLVEGSILDTHVLTPLINQADYVFHLAAAVGVFNIVNNPLASLLTNIRGTENVLEAAYTTRTPVFLTSSSEVYGKNVSDSLKESDDRILGSPVTLRWSYSEAKAIDESLAYAYCVEKHLEIRIVRFFNTVGPRQLGAYGMVVPRFVKSALTQEPITIYGDGKQTRCFAHVYDVIDAVIAIAFAKNTIGKVINIGNDFEISINDLAQKIIAETSSKSEIVHVPYEEAYGDGFEDMERRVPNIELINKLVGWKPQRNLSTMIADISLEMKKLV